METVPNGWFGIVFGVEDAALARTIYQFLANLVPRCGCTRCRLASVRVVLPMQVRPLLVLFVILDGPTGGSVGCS